MYITLQYKCIRIVYTWFVMTAARRKGRSGAGRGKPITSALAMDTLNFLHTQTLITTSQEGYNSTELFNDKRMVPSLHSYCFQGPNAPVRVKDALMEAKLQDIMPSVDALMGRTLFS